MVGLDRGQPGNRYPGAQGRTREGRGHPGGREEGSPLASAEGREAALVSLPGEWGSDLKGG